MFINLPLEVYTTKSKTKKSKWILNLNNYRNTHFTKLNAVKVAYKEAIKELIPNVSYDMVSLVYTLYPKSNRRTDVSNVCSIIDKFASDVLVDLEVIPDDDYEHVIEVVYRFGQVDKDNPRCELTIIGL